MASSCESNTITSDVNWTSGFSKDLCIKHKSPKFVVQIMKTTCLANLFTCMWHIQYFALHFQLFGFGYNFEWICSVNNIFHKCKAYIYFVIKKKFVCISTALTYANNIGFVMQHSHLP